MNVKLNEILGCQRECQHTMANAACMQLLRLPRLVPTTERAGKHAMTHPVGPRWREERCGCRTSVLFHCMSGTILGIGIVLPFLPKHDACRRADRIVEYCSSWVDEGRCTGRRCRIGARDRWRCSGAATNKLKKKPGATTNNNNTATLIFRPRCGRGPSHSMLQFHTSLLVTLLYQPARYLLGCCPCYWCH